jgi:hypothetical protein
MQDPALAKMVRMLIAQKGNVPQFAFGDTFVGKVVTGDFEGAAGDAGEVLKDTGKAIAGGLGGLFGGLLGPLWEQVKQKVFDELIWKMLEKNAFHTGGLIPAFAGGGEVPILAEAGEFMVSRKGVSSVGTDFLSSINKGDSVTGGAISISKIEIHAKTNLTPESIRTEIVPVMLKEIKKQSQDGHYVIASSGVR